MLIQTDALKKGWGAVCKRVRTGSLWIKEEQLLHINVLELLSIKLAVLTFTNSESVKSIHFQIDNKTEICYILKMGGTTNQTMLALSKEIWEVLLKKNATILAKYLASALNKEADWESRNNRNFLDWKLCPLIFQRIKSRFAHPQIDLFPSRLCHQLENDLSWKPDPHTKDVDAMQ